jgi:CDP-diglyceride synthetase
MVSEEQDQSQVSGQAQQIPAKAAGSRSKSKSKEAREQAISPKQSVWPFVLACALVVLLLGFIIHPIVLGIGVVLVAAAIIGWGLERR